MKARIYLFALMIVLLVATFTTTAAAKPAINPSLSKITIGLMDDYTGAFAGLCRDRRDGLLDYVKYLNDELGGIQGHEVAVKVFNNKLNPIQALLGWDTLRDAGAPVIVSWLSVFIPPVWQAAQKDRIPLFTSAGHFGLVYPKQPSYYFARAPQVAALFQSTFDLIAQDWAKKGKSGTPKVGVDVMDATTMPKMARKIVAFQNKKRGWQNVTFTTTSRAPADVTTQVLTMKNAGVEYLHIVGTGVSSIAWIKELDRQNFHPMVFGNFSFAENTYKATGNLGIGIVSYQVNAQYTDTDLPLIKLSHKVNAIYHPEITTRNGDYVGGFTDAAAVFHVLDKAVTAAGSAKVTGQMVKTAFETTRNFDPGIGAGYTWTPNDHQGFPAIRWYKYVGGGIMSPVTPWVTFEPLPEEQRTDAFWMK